jgi:hypothetical protein
VPAVANLWLNVPAAMTLPLLNTSVDDVELVTVWVTVLPLLQVTV